MTAVEMSANYTMFGEDPIIVSEPWQDDDRRFSAWDYAQEFANRYFEEHPKHKQLGIYLRSWKIIIKKYVAGKKQVFTNHNLSKWAYT